MCWRDAENALHRLDACLSGLHSHYDTRALIQLAPMDRPEHLEQLEACALALDQQRASLDSLWDQLSRMRAEIRRRRHQCHSQAASSPVSNVPVEILHRVFECILPCRPTKLGQTYRLRLMLVRSH